jgi:hypothetical protein
LAACGVGDDSTLGGDTGDTDERISCTAELQVRGTFTAAVALDPLGGCQPAGTWNVTVTAPDNGTCASVPLKGSYTYTVSGESHSTTISYGGSGDETRLQISASGDGSCHGSFEHIAGSSGNFTQFVFHPTLPKPTAAVTTLTIGGTGEFNLWKVHP